MQGRIPLLCGATEKTEVGERVYADLLGGISWYAQSCFPRDKLDQQRAIVASTRRGLLHFTSLARGRCGADRHISTEKGWLTMAHLKSGQAQHCPCSYPGSWMPPCFPDRADAQGSRCVVAKLCGP